MRCFTALFRIVSIVTITEHLSSSVRHRSLTRHSPAGKTSPCDLRSLFFVLFKLPGNTAYRVPLAILLFLVPAGTYSLFLYHLFV